MSDPTPEPDTRYRLAGPLVLRILGAQIILVGLILLLMSALVAFVGVPVGVLVAVALAGLLVVTATVWWLRARAAVITLTAGGYDVGLIRGVGVRAAAWAQVAEVVTSAPRGVACVVLRLEPGTETTIPVAALAVDREEFVRDLQRRLQSGHGLQRFS